MTVGISIYRDRFARSNPRCRFMIGVIILITSGQDR